MAKKYNNAELQFVRMNNIDIVTASLHVGTNTVTESSAIQAPDRRRSIWD